MIAAAWSGMRWYWQPNFWDQVKSKPRLLPDHLCAGIPGAWTLPDHFPPPNPPSLRPLPPVSRRHLPHPDHRPRRLLELLCPGPRPWGGHQAACQLHCNFFLSNLFSFWWSGRYYRHQHDRRPEEHLRDLRTICCTKRSKFLDTICLFLAPTGAQGMLMSVRPAQSALEQSIFIFLGQWSNRD